MDGRLKTLHPVVHGGLLGVRDNESHTSAMVEHGIEPVDLLVVNLYPFEKTIAKPGVTRGEAIEQIDIGGPAMIRSAAKNHQYVTVVVDPRDYDTVLRELKSSGSVSSNTRECLAIEAFVLTSRYDQVISEYLEGQHKTPF
jgi:phosphoribosylaminoimidazolecarboxamide formyltransferase / IMP cyclohydrolase